MRELDQPIERRDARIEDRGPRFDIRDVSQPARDRLDELRLLARGAKEDAGLHLSENIWTDVGQGRDPPWFGNATTCTGVLRTDA